MHKLFIREIKSLHEVVLPKKWYKLGEHIGLPLRMELIGDKISSEEFVKLESLLPLRSCMKLQDFFTCTDCGVFHQNLLYSVFLLPKHLHVMFTAEEEHQILFHGGVFPEEKLIIFKQILNI